MSLNNEQREKKKGCRVSLAVVVEKMMTSAQNKGKFPAFHRTPVKAREVLCNPSIKGVFGKLQTGLSASVRKYYKKKDDVSFRSLVCCCPRKARR